MKKLLALLLSLMLLVQLPAPIAFASFDDQGGGARAPGMADAFTAVADDADSIAYNPAGLIQLQEGQLTSQYGQLVKGLGDSSKLGTTYLGYALPIDLGYRAIGFAYQNFRGDNLFSERTITLSYGHRLDLEQYGARGIYSVGGNVKQLHRQYEQDRFTENALNDAGVASNQQDQLFTKGTSKDSYAVDVGALAQFGPKYQYTAGVAILNVNQPDVSIGNDGDRAPRALKFGLAYRPKWGTLTAESRQVSRLVGQTDKDMAIGLERNIPFATMGAMIVRGGYASGSRGYEAITAGLSYLFSRFRLDYSFAFPVGNLSDTTGSQHLGFSVRMGGGGNQFMKDYTDVDLLAAFAHDSLTDHILLSRISLGRNLTLDHKEQLMMLLLRKYSLDDEGLRNVRPELRELIRKYSANLMEWPQLKFALLKGIPDADKPAALEALDLLVKNHPKQALMRLAILPVSVQNSDRISAISVMALGELAAQTYRNNELESCIDYLRRVVEIMPSDEVVLRAYRELLARRVKISQGNKPSETETIKVPEVLPEAPPTLVAPVPQVEPENLTPAQETMSQKDAALKSFGAALGYYMMRKAVPATLIESEGLLNQMKAMYGSIGIDMSFVDVELKNLKKDSAMEKPAAVPQAPVKKIPVKSIQPAPVAKHIRAIKPKPAPAKPIHSGFKIPANADLRRAWEYYDEVSERDITDHERLELLQDMLKRFGEQGAGRINKELERIRHRLEQ